MEALYITMDASRNRKETKANMNGWMKEMSNGDIEKREACIKNEPQEEQEEDAAGGGNFKSFNLRV
jgi:hypothetical protein